MRDNYQTITDTIVSLLEAGVVPWRAPWRPGNPAANAVSKKPYRGVNAMTLNAQPFPSHWWVTYNQAQEMGGQVRKGERGKPIVFWSFVERKHAREGQDKHYPIMRSWTVFNAAQCDGLELPAAADITVPALASAEAILARMDGDLPTIQPVTTRGAQAAYVPSIDTVYIPDISLFDSAEHYYSTLFHELIHATGTPARLNRPGMAEEVIKFGSELYGFEELVAEMGAAMLCGRCGITVTHDLSASYIQTWIRVLKGDAKLVVKAAGAAQRAVSFILNEPAPGHEPDEVDEEAAASAS